MRVFAIRASYDGYYKYDRHVAATYERDRQHELHWQKEDEFIAGFFAGRSVKRLLDLPVGTGRFLQHYGDVEHVVGVDISEDMLAQARAKVASLGSRAAAITIEKGDSLALAYEDGYFDVTVVFRLLHLVPEGLLPVAIRELCRVTSGSLVVQTYATRSARSNSFTRRAVGQIVARIRSGQCWILRHRVVHAIRRRLAALRARAASASEPASAAAPWSHIEAFTYPQGRIDQLFARCGFYPAAARHLDEYTEHCEVRITVYQKRTAAAGTKP